jgi:formylglycine-generating enzyme required for sulfatase activity
VLGIVAAVAWTAPRRSPGRGPERRPTPVAALKTITNTIGMRLVLIPDGELLIDSPESDTDASADQKPQRQMRVTRPFFLGVTEVTQGQYQAVIGVNPSHFKGSPNLPVETVSWFDAINYCNALSRKESLTPFYRVQGTTVDVPDGNGTGYRLPTDIEWEYACRAGTTTRYSFGNEAGDLDPFAWYFENSRLGTQNVRQSHPVGRRRANAWGVYDMLGNVEEWCWDRYDGDDDDDSSAKPSAADGVGGSPSTFRLHRGGCWRLGPERCESDFRAGNLPSHRSPLLGFRVARVASSR